MKITKIPSDDQMELSVYSCWTAKLLLRAKLEHVTVDKHGKYISIHINDDETAKPFFESKAFVGEMIKAVANLK